MKANIEEPKMKDVEHCSGMWQWCGALQWYVATLYVLIYSTVQL